MRPIRALRRFHEDCRGSLTVEAVLILPLLIWVYVATFVFFDAFRIQNTNAKAAYAISDLLSRQTMPVTPDFLDGLGDLYAFITNGRHPTRMRVSSIDWDPVNERYRIQWSYGTHGGTPLNAQQLDELANRMPVLSTGESLILVETELDYTPPIEVGVQPQRLVNFIPTRPRFAPRLVMQGVTS